MIAYEKRGKVRTGDVGVGEVCTIGLVQVEVYFGERRIRAGDDREGYAAVVYGSFRFRKLGASEDCTEDPPLIMHRQQTDRRRHWEFWTNLHAIQKEDS